MKYIWLDCDPGHDDATAILLAVHAPDIKLLGVSTSHGNAGATNTMNNAARCLHAFGAPDDIKIYPGAPKPLIRLLRHDPQIHGPDGLGGVEGLPSITHPEVAARIQKDINGQKSAHAIHGLADAIRDTWKDGEGHHVTIVATGPLTNIALFVSVYPDLVTGVDEIVFMGGGVGIGNRSAVAEFNILCDPEAAQIVLDVPVKKIMIPLNVTHTAILTREIHRKLLSPESPPTETNSPLPAAVTPLRHMLSTLVSFFAESYESTFGFTRGPPIHDALTVAYIFNPQLFGARRFRVDIELGGAHTAGETVVDIWNYKGCDDTWGRDGKNCIVTESLNVDRFFEFFLDCVKRCDQVSPLNLK
ncbi:Inosine/uridine-preferring nucleoside hydrolase domain-containing protein [Irpex rosettiformis]|uniref:Inosine/uridine-preferring nucleoside hydrolase domain-containing protein n=1 Tax=Irpex rosettiformis TaxID=378272 RepID=A0ACB8UCR0_9APHY|nr:Inosine/uridine-preferring nucleoside hydrolase domain-containing protein [Irpex rosettiformis]